MNEKELKNIETGILLKGILDAKKETKLEKEFDPDANEQVDFYSYNKKEFIENLEKSIKNNIDEKLAEVTNAEKILEDFDKKYKEENFTNESYKEHDELNKIFLDGIEYGLRKDYKDIDNEFYKGKEPILKELNNKPENDLENNVKGVMLKGIIETSFILNEKTIENPEYGSYDNEFYNKEEFLTTFKEEINNFLPDFVMDEAIDFLKPNATELGLHINDDKIIEFYDEDYEEHDYNEAEEFIKNKLKEFALKEFEKEIYSLDNTDDKIFKPMVENLSNNLRMEFTDPNYEIVKYASMDKVIEEKETEIEK